MRHAVSTLLFERPGLGLSLFPFPEGMERREAPEGLRDPLVARLARPRRTPERSRFARPAPRRARRIASGLRGPLRRRCASRRSTEPATGRPDCHEAHCRRPALPARPRRVMTAPDRVERELGIYASCDTASRQNSCAPADSVRPRQQEPSSICCSAGQSLGPRHRRSERTMFVERLCAGMNEACCYYVLCHPGRMLYSSAHAIHAPSG